MIFKIQDGRWLPFLKIEKLGYFKNCLTDFDEIWHNDASWPTGPHQPIKIRDSLPTIPFTHHGCIWLVNVLCALFVQNFSLISLYCPTQCKTHETCKFDEILKSGGSCTEPQLTNQGHICMRE